MCSSFSSSISHTDDCAIAGKRKNRMDTGTTEKPKKFVIKILIQPETRARFVSFPSISLYMEFPLSDDFSYLFFESITVLGSKEEKRIFFAKTKRTSMINATYAAKPKVPVVAR